MNTTHRGQHLQGCVSCYAYVGMEHSERQITPAERDRLRRLHSKIETAKNFTQGTKAIEQMDAFQERLLAKGVTVEAILKALGN